jgi:hypothetical protein
LIVWSTGVTVFGVVLHPAKRQVAPIVVAAGVHATVVLRPIWDVVGLVDRQGIHIRPQPDRRTIAGSKNADHASLADVAVNLAAELGKLAGENSDVRCSSMPSSGCACRSCRQADILL